MDWIGSQTTTSVIIKPFWNPENICVTMFLGHCNNKYLNFDIVTTLLGHCNNKYLNFDIVTTFHETVTTNSYCYIVYSM